MTKQLHYHFHPTKNLVLIKHILEEYFANAIRQFYFLRVIVFEIKNSLKYYLFTINQT